MSLYYKSSVKQPRLGRILTGQVCAGVGMGEELPGKALLCWAASQPGTRSLELPKRGAEDSHDLGTLIGMGTHPKAWGAGYKPELAKPEAWMGAHSTLIEAGDCSAGVRWEKTFSVGMMERFHGEPR